MGSAITFLSLGVVVVARAVGMTPMDLNSMIVGVILAALGVAVIFLRESGYIKQPVDKYVAQGLGAALPFVIEYVETGTVPDYNKMVDALGEEVTAALMDYFEVET